MLHIVHLKRGWNDVRRRNTGTIMKAHLNCTFPIIWLQVGEIVELHRFVVVAIFAEGFSDGVPLGETVVRALLDLGGAVGAGDGKRDHELRALGAVNHR